MTKQFSTTQPWLKRMLITALAVLLSGSNCLFCCGQLLTFAAPVEEKSEESCATRSQEVSGEDNCCSEDSSKSGHSVPTPCNDDCCILSAPLAENPGVFRYDPQSATTAHAALLLQTIAQAERAVVPHHIIPSFHKQETYLHCCVFLI